MKPAAYYNEFEPYAAGWLRNLIAAGLIAPGDVDTRSIHEVTPDDLRGYCQVHLFAGLGGWSYAARLAGWPDDRPLWTGSCPCQPFSVAGKGDGVDDPRHLWPVMGKLVAECDPTVVFGEQVAGRAGRAWLDGVRADLERMGYAVGAADLCSAGAGAPNIRQRLYWVADAESRGLRVDRGAPGQAGHPHECGEAGGLADSNRSGQRPGTGRGQSEGGTGERDDAGRGGTLGWMADTSGARGQRGLREGDSLVDGDGSPSGRGLGDAELAGLEGYAGHGDDRGQSGRVDQIPGGSTRAAGRAGFWDAYDLVPCLDGKTRRIEPGLKPLAHGIPARVGKLRAYGNAINPEVASRFMSAWLAVSEQAA